MMSSAAQPVEIIPGHHESHSGIGRKPFAFPPESLFAFSPESCSSSPRNAFRVHPGILFALPRNPQPSKLDAPIMTLSQSNPLLSFNNRQYGKLRSCENPVLGAGKFPEGGFSGWVLSGLLSVLASEQGVFYRQYGLYRQRVKYGSTYWS